MNIFEEELEVLEEDSELLEEQPLQEWGVDFESGQMTGRLVEGSEAVKVWAWNALQTPRYRYLTHSWFYGQDFEELIGQQYSPEYVETVLYSMVEDCLLVNPNILEVTELSYTFEEEKIHLCCKLMTTYGEEEVHV